MKVGLIQLNSVGDKVANIDAARILMERCIAEENPDWLCLPEFFDFIGDSRVETLATEEPLPGGPAYTMLQDIPGAVWCMSVAAP